MGLPESSGYLKSDYQMPEIQVDMFDQDEPLQHEITTLKKQCIKHNDALNHRFYRFTTALEHVSSGEEQIEVCKNTEPDRPVRVPRQIQIFKGDWDENIAE